MQNSRHRNENLRLCDKSAGSGTLVSPGGWENANGLVVAGQTVDTGLDENETELGVLVFPVALKVLADGNSLIIGLAKQTESVRGNIAYLLDQHVQVLWDLRCQACYFSPSVKDQTEAI